MGIISLSSGSSCWRGLDYYKEKRVVELNGYVISLKNPKKRRKVGIF